MTQRTTEMFLAAWVLALLAYDIIAVYRGGWDCSVSQVVSKLSREYPIIPLVVGIVCGHWFWHYHKVTP